MKVKKRLFCLIGILCMVLMMLTGCDDKTKLLEESQKASEKIEPDVYLAQIEKMMTDDEISFKNLKLIATSPVGKDNFKSIISYIVYSFDNTRDHKHYICLAPVKWNDASPDVLYRYDSFDRIDSERDFTAKYMLDAYDSINSSEQKNIVYGEIRNKEINKLQFFDDNGKLEMTVDISDKSNGFAEVAHIGDVSEIKALDKSGKVIDTFKGADLVWE